MIAWFTDAFVRVIIDLGLSSTVPLGYGSDNQSLSRSQSFLALLQKFDDEIAAILVLASSDVSSLAITEIALLLVR